MGGNLAVSVDYEIGLPCNNCPLRCGCVNFLQCIRWQEWAYQQNLMEEEDGNE